MEFLSKLIITESKLELLNLVDDNTTTNNLDTKSPKIITKQGVHWHSLITSFRDMKALECFDNFLTQGKTFKGT